MVVMKDRLFSIDEVEHYTEHVLGVKLPDALAKVQEARKYHLKLQEQFGRYPCIDCMFIIPELLKINRERCDAE